MAATMPSPDDSGGADASADPDAGSASDSSSGDGSGDDLSQGYCIEISVLPDGTFSIAPPESLQTESQEEQGSGEEAGADAGQTFTSIGDVLKAVIGIVKQNPVGSGGASDQDQFNAGYGQG